jgi:hypothetical protein
MPARISVIVGSVFGANDFIMLMIMLSSWLAMAMLPSLRRGERF